MPSKESLTANITVTFESAREALVNELNEAWAPVSTCWHTARYDPETRRVIFQDAYGEDAETSEADRGRAIDFVNGLEANDIIVDEANTILPQNDFVVEWVHGPARVHSHNGSWELCKGEKSKKEPEFNITISEKLNLIGAKDVESE